MKLAGQCQYSTTVVSDFLTENSFTAQLFHYSCLPLKVLMHFFLVKCSVVRFKCKKDILNKETKRPTNVDVSSED